MRRHVVLMGVLLCLVLSVGGCKKKSEAPAQGELEQQLGVAGWKENFQVTVPEIGKVTVAIDLKPDVLLTEKPYVMKISYLENTEALKKSILTRLYKYETVFYWDEEHWTKEYLEEKIIETEKGWASIENVELLEKYRALYPNAPENPVQAEAYTVNEYLIRQESEDRVLCFGEDPVLECFYIQLRTLGEYKKMIPERLSNEQIVGIGMYPDYENSQSGVTNYCKYSLEEAKEIANLFFSAFGINSVEKLRVRNLIWTIKNPQTEAIEEVVGGYMMAYEPWKDEEYQPGYLPMEIYISDCGVFKVDFYEPFAVTSYTQNVPLLPFEQIKECVRKELKNPQSVLWERFREVHANQIGEETRFDISYLSLQVAYCSGEKNETSLLPGWQLDYIGVFNAIDGGLIWEDEES